MIIINNNTWLYNDMIIFFPNKEEILNLFSKAALNDIVRVRQTDVELPYCQPGVIHREIITTNCIDLTRCIEDLYRDMDPKSCRYEIRKAEKIRQDIVILRNGDGVFEDFFRLYNDFVKQKGHERQLSRKRFQQYLKLSDIFVAYFKDRPVCGHLLLRDETTQRLRLLFSGSSRLCSREDAAIVSPLNRYLHWYEFQTYKGEGMKVYDFGGTSLGGSIARFKLSFGGIVLKEHCYVFSRMLGTGLGNPIYKSYLVMTQMRASMSMAVKAKVRRGRKLSDKVHQ